MRSFHLLALPLALVTASVVAANPVRVAALLPEVLKQIAEAHHCVETGSLESAAAHADLVLLSDNVAVNVAYDGISSKEQKTCDRALDASLAAWQSVLSDSIHFRREVDPSKADICVRFKPDVKMGAEAVAGFTKWKRSIKTEGQHVLEARFKADMQVRARDLNRSSMSFEAMRQEAEHELGHVLGLEDSEHQGDLMGALNVAHLVSGPRDNEIDAVRALRYEAKQIKADIASKQKAAN